MFYDGADSEECDNECEDGHCEFLLFEIYV